MHFSSPSSRLYRKNKRKNTQKGEREEGRKINT
jgi:hypothetical protein